MSYTFTHATAISGRQHLRSAATETLVLYWFHTPGLQLDNEVLQSTDQLHGTVCHQHYGHRAWRTAPFKWALKTHLFSITRRHWEVFVILAPDINIQTYLLTYLLAHKQLTMIQCHIITFSHALSSKLSNVASSVIIIYCGSNLYCNLSRKQSSTRHMFSKQCKSLLTALNKNVLTYLLMCYNSNYFLTMETQWKRSETVATIS